MITFNDFGNEAIYIGKHGENIVNGIDIDCTAVLDTGWGAGLLLKRPNDSTVYPATATLTSGILHVVFSSADTQYEGTGEATLIITGANGEVKKSATATTVIEHALSASGTTPSPVTEWTTAATAKLSEVDTAMEEMLDSKITEAEATVDANTGTPAVTVTLTEASEEGQKISFAFANIKGATGAKGDTGEKGDKGDTGEQGISGVYVGSGTIPQGYNVQVDPTGSGEELITEAPNDGRTYGRKNKAWTEVTGGGGGGGTSDFDALTNRPSYNGTAMSHSTNIPEVKTAAWDGYAATIAGKVDKVTGKGLSTEDYTAVEKTKLAGIAAGAEVNVQSDWTQSDTIADDYIKNKPTLATVATSGSYNDLSNKPTIPAAQVNSDWNAVSGVAQILNKPTIPDDADEITYDSSAASHTAGSVGAEIATLKDDKVSYPNHPSDNKFYAMKNDQWVEFSGGGGGDTAGVVAPAYSAQSTYTKGALVIQNQLLYEAKADISVAEAWTAAHWTQTTVDAVLANYQKYGNLAVSVLDENGNHMTGITLTVMSQTDGTTFGTYNYSGATINIKTPYGNAYKIISSYKQGYVTPPPQWGTGVPTSTLTITYKTGVVYGFHINGNEAEPNAKVTYIQGTDAYGLTPAHMDFTNDVFDYGSWENAFFMPRPCMLKYDGTVDYYLDPNNYTKKADGVSASDITDTNYGGNAMMEWGQNGQKIWYKIVPDDGDDYSASIYISNEQVDSDYVSWSFIDAQNNPIDHFYTPIYNGSNVSSKLRSISGLSILSGATASTEIDYAKANNVHQYIEWYTEVMADIQLINFLLILMAKTTQTQGAYGYGHHTGGSSASNLLRSGTMDTKGMFWGSDQTGVGVKVFGMENWWANQWRRYAGHMNISNIQKFKMTCGTADGSTAAEYNLDGTGYITTGTTITGTSDGYITRMKFFSRYGMFPVLVNATSSTQYCDGMWFSSGTMYPFRGGTCSNGLFCGAFTVHLLYPASLANWYLGAAPSCKPLAQVE